MVRTRPIVSERRSGDQRPSARCGASDASVKDAGSPAGRARERCGAGSTPARSPRAGLPARRIPRAQRGRAARPRLPRGRVTGPPQAVERQQRGPEDRRRVERRSVARGRRRGSPAAIRASNRASRALNTPPAMTTSGSRPGQVEPADDRARHGHELVGEPVDDRARDRDRPRAAAPKTTGDSSPRRRCGHASRARSPGSGRSGGQAEVARHGRLERRPRPPAVARPDGRPERGQADVAAAAPVARDVAQRRQPRGPAVGAIPAAFIPEPQIRAIPQPRDDPARIGAKASLTTSAASPPGGGRRALRVSRRVSAGVSAPASA